MAKFAPVLPGILLLSCLPNISRSTFYACVLLGIDTITATSVSYFDFKVWLLYDSHYVVIIEVVFFLISPDFHH